MPEVYSDFRKLLLTNSSPAYSPFYKLIKSVGKFYEEDEIIYSYGNTSVALKKMYKSRFAIELFFNWIKQPLNIKKFYGQSEWAIQNQVFIVLIVFCLHVLVQLETKSKRKTLQIAVI
ncbi:transposase IS4 family protein [Jeotgalibacillus soli]|uniref:Transposase IS4 family protein n=1 Tax=Jeotgalibacillus soli TaxID=889306 RepID=A0A0C2VX34_9BACL|nr:transposase IS4 family protein [Jeotgalibacillus soli]